VTGTPLSRSKGQGHQAALLTAVLKLNINQLQRWAWEHIDRGNLLLRCGLQAQSDQRREALRRPQREERGGDILWQLPAQLVTIIITSMKEVIFSLAFVC